MRKQNGNYDGMVKAGRKSFVSVIKNLLVPVMAGGLFAVMPAVAAEEDSSIDYEITVDYFSRYIWRGQQITDDSVIQPGATMAFDKITLGFWGNVDMTDTNGTDWEFNETDWYVDYTTDVPGVENVSFSVGYIYYQFPHADDTQEIYWGFGFDLLFQPSITVYHDFDEAEGTYVSLGFGHSFEKFFELSPDMPVGLDLGLSVGWADSGYNDFYWGVDESAMNDLVVSVGFPMQIGDWSVSPSLNYITVLDSKISDAGDDDHFVVGVSAGYSF